MISSQKAKKKLLTILRKTENKVRTFDRDFPLTHIAWMVLNGELAAIEDPEFHKDLMALSRKANDYRRRYWKIEEAIKQDFIHRMSKLRFSPSYSPEIDTLKSNLPNAVMKDDGRLWTYSFDYYIGEIAKKVGRNKEEAPSGSSEFSHYSNRFSRDVKTLRNDALDLLRYIATFSSKLDNFISTGTRWTALGNVQTISPKIGMKKQMIILKRPFPLPKKSKPKKRLFRRMKRETVGPGGPS